MDSVPVSASFILQGLLLQPARVTSGHVSPGPLFHRHKKGIPIQRIVFPSIVCIVSNCIQYVGVIEPTMSVLQG